MAGSDFSPTSPFSCVATSDDILACFRLLLGRYPGEAEWVDHSALAGSPLHELVAGYLNSLEFRQRGLIQLSKTMDLVDLERFQMYVSSDDPLVGNVIRNSKTYEPPVTDIFLEYVHAGANVLDIGANIGYFSLLAASLVGPSGSVLACEPLLANIKVLAANRIANGFNNIEVLAVAASD